MDKQEYQKRLGRLLDKHWALITGQAPIYEHATTEETLQAICLLNEEAMPKERSRTIMDTEGDFVYGHKSPGDKGYNHAIKELKQIIGVSNE